MNDPDHEPATLLEMTRAMAGDTDALGRVLDRYRVRLTAAVIAAGVYRGVEDVVQDAMLKIVSAVRQGRLEVKSVEEFRAWMHSIARSCAVDALRRMGREPRHIDSMLAAANDDGPQASERIKGHEPGPSACARTQELTAELRRRRAERLERIAELRPQDQMLVWMRERDGLSFQAIAAALGQNLGVALKEDAMRMRYTRLVRDRIGSTLSTTGDSTAPTP